MINMFCLLMGLCHPAMTHHATREEALTREVLHQKIEVQMLLMAINAHPESGQLMTSLARSRVELGLHRLPWLWA